MMKDLGTTFSTLKKKFDETIYQHPMREFAANTAIVAASPYVAGYAMHAATQSPTATAIAAGAGFIGGLGLVFGNSLHMTDELPLDKGPSLAALFGGILSGVVLAVTPVAMASDQAPPPTVEYTVPVDQAAPVKCAGGDVSVSIKRDFEGRATSSIITCPKPANQNESQSGNHGIILIPKAGGGVHMIPH